VFSDRYKEIVGAKEKIGGIFDEMRRAHSLRKYFEFDFPAFFDNRNIKKISELTKDFEASLRLWRRRIPATVREDVRRLNAKTIHAALDYREQIKDLEYAMDVFLEEFNAAGLYNATLKHEMLTIPKRQEFLEDMIAQLEDTQFYLRDFDDFYIWQKHWLELKPAAQKVVRALCKVKPHNWQAALESWYLHHLLQNEFSPGFQWDDESLASFNASARALRDIMPHQIGAYWQSRKNKALRAMRSESALSFKTWFGKNNRALAGTQKAEELFRKHIEPLTETLPALLVTPQVALDVVQNSNMVFDLVLVDEAHNIPKQECYHLFDLAKNLVVCGDSKQDMTPGAEDDFLEFCKGIGAKTLQLEYQHQDSPEAWVRFNKIAFGTPFKRLPSGRNAQDVTVVENVGGRYDEKNYTNEAEARQVIDWLNLVEPTAAKNYPVVGIACATVQQRDLIAGHLLRIRQQKAAGYEKIQQLHLSGMGVYQFAELQGQHVDILFISLTHGMIDSQGALTRHLHFWNSEVGFNQLHIALTRATQKLFIAHSIPPGLHTVLASDKNFIGTCVLSHLVTFAESIQRGDAVAAEDQLVKMRALLNYTEQSYPFTTFMEEVEIALRPYFETRQMRRNGIAAAMRVPLYLEGRTKAESNSVLLFDGVLAPSAHPAYEWEEKVKNYFQKQGINCAPAYAAHWWKSPKQEARRLAGRLLRKEGNA
jgi:AAA domain